MIEDPKIEIMKIYAQNINITNMWIWVSLFTTIMTFNTCMYTIENYFCGEGL